MTRVARHPDPPPLETDDARTIAVGAAAWAVALVVLVVLRAVDATRIEGWWLLMCAYGLLLGLVGTWHCRRRQEAIARDKARGLPPPTQVG